MILAADIGGTKCLLALARREDGELLEEKRYASADFANLESLLARFLDDHGIPASAVAILSLALAGPVSEECVALTNLPWLVCQRSLEKQFPDARILFVNDFQAAALGVLQVDETQLLTIREAPMKPGGRKLVMGAGTGMGVAWLQPLEGEYRAWSSEAGHIGFAPQDDQQWRLHRHLQARHGRVSWERLLSGPGLAAIHAFLSGREAAPEPPAIIDEANAGDNETAVETLSLFTQLYGCFCGDMALAWPADGGIYLVGGVTTHVTRWLQQPIFEKSFTDKGRMSHLVEGFPIQVVLEPRVGLLGAVSQALQMQERS